MDSAPASSDATRLILPPPHCAYLAELRHQPFKLLISLAPPDQALLSKWRMKDRMKTASVALVVCLNIGVDPPDVIKVSPCARMECWIDPSSMAPQKALDAIGGNLQAQYERWQPRARYKLALDPTVEEVKKLCSQCRKSAKSERVLFHYNGHGVPKPTASGELWFFNKSYTQYIPLSVYELEVWLGDPSVYVLDCSGAGVLVNAFVERPEWAVGTHTPFKDSILLAACGAMETLPLNSELPADLFTACLTTPIKIALRWFCSRSLLGDAIYPELIDKIPGRQNDRKTLLGELNWIFTAITDTIAWNVLPRDLFQRLFRQDLLVASLFRNFLLAERVMRSLNCTPVSYPPLPLTHQHPMWYAWDMAAEACLSQLTSLLNDPNQEFQPSPFFAQQLTAFEVWLEHGSATKTPPEQLPIVLQVLYSQSHRFRALVLLGRFLDLGPWAIDLALSVGIFAYVLKLLHTSATELRQILVFIWAKILAHDKSCQADLVKDGGHQYFIKFLDSPDAYGEQQAMAVFVLAVINDGFPRGQLDCLQSGLMEICLRHIVPERGEPLLMQWLSLCLGKLWDGLVEAQLLALHTNAFSTLVQLLSEPQPEVRAAAAYALGTLINCKCDLNEDATVDDDDDEARLRMELEVTKTLLKLLHDGSPLVRGELAIALARLTVHHNSSLRLVAAAYLKPPSNPAMVALTGLGSTRSPTGSQFFFAGGIANSQQAKSEKPEVLGKAFAIRRPLLMNSRATASAPVSPAQGLDFIENECKNGMMRSRKLQAEETSVYVRCVSAAYSLARDPCPWVAGFGQDVLKRIGVEAYIVQVAGVKGVKATGRIFPRSASWVDNNLGSISVPFRAFGTPPARALLFSGTTAGMQKTPSMDLLLASESIKESQSPDLSSASSDQIPTAETSAELPRSVLYTWSCGHFARPLLENENDEEEVRLLMKERREEMALDGVQKCQRSNVSKIADQCASWDANSDSGIKDLLLHPFMPVACIADDNEIIRMWNYEDDTLVNSFQNHDLPEKGLTRLILMNELDESLLLVASSDGSMRVWKDYLRKDEQKLATAWQSIQGHRPGARSISAVVEWQQSTGYLYASGEISSIMIWDVDAESLILRLPSQPDTSVCAMAASRVQSGLSVAGCANGYLMMFDVRQQNKMVFSLKAHTQRIVGTDFVQSGLDTTKVSAASQGGIKIFDVRKLDLPVVDIEAHKGHLTSLAVHRHASLMASGSAKQCIRVINTGNGEQVNMIHNSYSFLGQRIGPVSSMYFHPYRILLAAGASTDSIVSIYAGDSTPAAAASASASA